MDETVIRRLNPTVTILTKPFSRFGIFRIGGRASIIKLKTSSLAVISPVALTPAVKAEVESLGNKVQYLIAPDFEHHIYLGEWQQAYPNAQLIGVEGLDKLKKELKFSYIYTSSTSPTLPKELADEVDTVYFPGFANKDIAFFHKPTKTMFTADLMFNLPAKEAYSKSKLSPTMGVTWLFNTLHYDSLAHKRFLWYLAGADREAMKKSAKEVAKWDIEMIVPCHGEVIEKPAAQTAWSTLYKWFLE